MDVCHDTVALLLGLIQRWIKHTVIPPTMAFLLKHVAPLKLWVVAVDFPHLFFAHPLLLSHSLSVSLSLFRLPRPISCFASCIVCILASPISEPSFPLSHTMDFFLFFTSSAKSNSWCQQNMFFISLKKNVWRWECSFPTADVIDNSRQNGLLHVKKNH